MNSKDVLPNRQIETATDGEHQERIPVSRPAVRIKEVPERDRRRLLMHFLALSNRDRLMRFGTVLSDELITRYVQHLDFLRDTVLGVYDAQLHLVGVGHLAFAPREALPLVAGATIKERVAEFGVSVSASARSSVAPPARRASRGCIDAGVITPPLIRYGGRRS